MVVSSQYDLEWFVRKQEIADTKEQGSKYENKKINI